MLELTDIVGQDAAIRKLREAMACDRTPHAYLFVGPAGVGRRTTALAFARTLLCLTPPDQRSESAGPPSGRTACGVCQSCKLIDSQTHPDLHVIRKELAQYHDDASVRDRKMQELSIDVIRTFLIAPAGLAGAYGHGKIFIVLEAELMSAAAQNSLLKTLEEPPPGVTIILIARQSQQMLPTTQSRCWAVRFAALPQGFVVSRLTAAGVGKGEAEFWARFTDGSVGEGSTLAAQGLYKLKSDIIERLGAPEAGPVELGEHLAKSSDALAEQIVKDAKKDQGIELSKLLASRRAAGVMLRLIGSAYCDALHQSTGAGGAISNCDQGGPIKALSRRFGPQQLAEIIEQLSVYETLLWRNVNPRTVWDNVALTCCSATPLEVS